MPTDTTKPPSTTQERLERLLLPALVAVEEAEVGEGLGVEGLQLDDAASEFDGPAPAEAYATALLHLLRSHRAT